MEAWVETLRFLTQPKGGQQPIENKQTKVPENQIAWNPTTKELKKTSTRTTRPGKAADHWGQLRKTAATLQIVGAGLAAELGRLRGTG